MPSVDHIATDGNDNRCHTQLPVPRNIIHAANPVEAHIGNHPRRFEAKQVGTLEP
jgi:hypothetical protein